jgi:hypothetical protein
MNDPVWVLGQVKGFFNYYLNYNDPTGMVVVGVPSEHGGVGASVPAEWITERDING